ncbi:MAG TPA: EAL domain-containing protein [Rhodanobacteraceae bacterium]
MGIESDPPLADFLEAARQRVQSATSFQDAFAHSAQLICNAQGWSAAHAWVREDGNLLRSTGTWYFREPEPGAAVRDFQTFTESQTFTAGDGLPGSVLAGEGARWLAELTRGQAFRRSALAAAAGWNAALMLPMTAGDEIVGVAEFFARATQPPTPRLLAVLAVIGADLGPRLKWERVHGANEDHAQRTRQILDAVNNAFIAIDTSGKVTEWNRAAERIFGWPREAAMHRPVSELIIPERLRRAHEQGIRRYLTTRVPHFIGTTRELPALHRDGHEFPIEITYWTYGRGDQETFYTFARDITARKRREADLERRAHFDPLTGLPNRKRLMDVLHELLAEAERIDRGLAVLFVDLDNLKQINDNLGHAAGDDVLVALAKGLRRAVRPMDTVARLGGDEFVIVCPDVKTHADARLIAERIRGALRVPVRIAKDSVYLSVSTGIVLAEQGNDEETLLSAADTAMYEAKRSGHGQYELFNEQMRARAVSRMRTENDLHDAIEDGQLRLYFQNIVNAATGEVAAAEALLRWMHPTRGLLLPAEFIHIAEESGLIVPIGAWVLQEACRCAHAWRDRCDTRGTPCLSVNLSARQFAQSDLVATIAHTLDAAGIDPRRVQFGFEVTESVVMRNPDQAAKVLRDLKAMGVRLSIDDFGTGYSSLAYLREFPVDTLKIDRSFVTNLPSDATTREIVRAVTNMGHALGMSIIAEGVETQAQADAARDARVDLLQGFFYARPEPPDSAPHAASEAKGQRGRAPEATS